MKTFFISDTHFGHKNIIQYTNRPFASVDEMDKALIANWNTVVSPNDTVYHLGDFTLGSGDMAERYFSQLKGKIIIITSKTHHDKQWVRELNHGKVYKSLNNYTVQVCTESIYSLTIVNSGEGIPNKIVLCHFPMLEWEDKHYGSWHLHGHIHNNTYDIFNKRLNICVERIGYTPISLLEVRDLIITCHLSKEK